MLASFTRLCPDLPHYLGTFKSELMEKFWTVLKDKRTWCFFSLSALWQNPKKQSWERRRVKRQRNKEKGKGDSWSHTACQKTRSERHTCDILASQTCRHRRKLVLPSWAGGSSAFPSAVSVTAPSTSPARGPLTPSACLLEPNCCVGSLLQRLQCPTAQDLTSSVLSLLTMHSTVPIPKMTGCVDFNMFHIVSASFCIKKTI